MDDRLDAAGRRFGAGKSSLQRDVLRHYAPLISPFRNASFDLLEIGVGDGASLRMWLDYFPNARVVGLDVRRLSLPDLPERCTLIHGAQDDLGLLLDLVRRYRFRLIVDDGSSDGRVQLAAFATLFPAIESGGIYTCESIWNDAPPPVLQAQRPPPDPDEPGIDHRHEPIAAETGRREAGFLDLITALGRAAASGEAPDPLPIDRARFAALRRRTASVRFLPRLVVVTATEQQR